MNRNYRSCCRRMGEAMFLRHIFPRSTLSDDEMLRLYQAAQTTDPDILRSDGFNFLSLANAYMNQAVAHPDNLAARAKAEKYAKILSKTIINPDGDSGSYGQNAFFVRP